MKTSAQVLFCGAAVPINIFPQFLAKRWLPNGKGKTTTQWIGCAHFDKKAAALGAAGKAFAAGAGTVVCAAAGTATAAAIPVTGGLSAVAVPGAAVSATIATSTALNYAFKDQEARARKNYAQGLLNEGAKQLDQQIGERQAFGAAEQSQKTLGALDRLEGKPDAASATGNSPQDGAKPENSTGPQDTGTGSNSRASGEASADSGQGQNSEATAPDSQKSKEAESGQEASPE